MKKTILLKTALFLMVFGIIFSAVYKVLIAPEDDISYYCVEGFYEEKDNSLDAVYIGSSSVWAYWMAPIAWHDNGITVFPYSTGLQPLQAALPILKEARKTQPNALYIININGIYDSFGYAAIHRITTYPPFSIDRFDTINTLCDINDDSFNERFEFYFPLFRFHSRWNNLSKKNFHYAYDGLKGGLKANIFLTVSKDVTSNLQNTTRRGVLSDSLEKSLKELIDYCDNEGIKVLFVISPRITMNEGYWAKINTINDYVISRGYTCLDLLNHIDEIGLDLTTDYYSGEHNNVHGALKTTKFLAEYLIKNYGFQDKRGEAKYSDWDLAYTDYMKVITPYVVDIETNYEKRDYTLPAPKLNNITVNGTTLTVSWDASKDAKGYRVYRKEEDSPWEVIVSLDGATLRYTDRNCKRGKTYTYTVVPWHMADGEKAWGRFDIKGVKAKALLNAPALVSLDKTNDGVKISWKKVKGAAGYKVFRRLPDKNWIMLKDVENTDSYVDNAVLDNLPFCYTVRGYTVDEKDKKIDGSQNTKGLLYLPELTMTTVVAAVNNGEVTLTWDAAEGMNGYKIYRNEELIAELPDSAVQFTDRPGYGQYKYRVETFFKFGSEVHAFNLNNSFEWVECK